MSHSELSAQAPRRTRDRILDAARIVAIALFPYPFLVLFAWGVPYGWVYVFAYGGWVLFASALIWVRRGHTLFPKLPHTYLFYLSIITLVAWFPLSRTLATISPRLNALAFVLIAMWFLLEAAHVGQKPRSKG